MNSKSEILLAIKLIGEKLEAEDVVWVIGGSVSLLLRGIDVVPNDIDLVVDPKYRNKVMSALSSCITNKSKSGEKIPFKIKSISGKIMLLNINRDNLTSIQLGGVEIPVFKLEVEYWYYKLRTDKVEANRRKIKLIEKALDLLE